MRIPSLRKVFGLKRPPGDHITTKVYGRKIQVSVPVTEEKNSYLVALDDDMEYKGDFEVALYSYACAVRRDWGSNKAYEIILVLREEAGQVHRAKPYKHDGRSHFDEQETLNILRDLEARLAREKGSFLAQKVWSPPSSHYSRFLSKDSGPTTTSGVEAHIAPTP